MAPVLNERHPRDERTSPNIAALSNPGDPKCVSIIAPCRNEAGHIDAFCDSALAQRLPEGWRLEIIVADGMSDDGTVEILTSRIARDPRLRLVLNKGLIVSTGLNAALAQAKGEVIVRMDVHTQFAPDYVSACLQALARTGADNVGGAWVARGTGPTGCAVAAAFQCPWVVGGALSRQQTYEGRVDTVYLGCWPRDVLAAVGGFDETLVRNQDDEHNLRLRLAGRTIWQSATIRSLYRPRDSLGHLFRQQFQYGYWRPFVMRKHGQPGSARQLVPAAFAMALVMSMLILPWRAWPLVALLAAYGAYLLLASMMAAAGSSDKLAHGPGALATWSMRLRLPAVIAAYHLGYGLGTWRGLVDLALGRRVIGTSAKITR